MPLLVAIIIIAIIGITAGQNALKGIQFSLPTLSLGLGLGNSTQEKTQPANTKTPSTKIYTPSSPRAPPVTQGTRSTALPTQKSTNSPYFQKIRIGSFQATTTSPARITLNANFNDATPINITGWRIKSTWAGDFIIPLGISQFHSTPISAPTDQILVTKDDTVYLLGDTDPFGRGVNFRPNACFGYLNQYYRLPESFSCPQHKPGVAEVKNLTPLCQDYVLNQLDYGACRFPNYSGIPGVATNQECTSYIANLNDGFNYEKCFSNHSAESGFFFNRWYIYMDTTFGNPLHDSITLYDKQGLVVDAYTY